MKRWQVLAAERRAARLELALTVWDGIQQELEREGIAHQLFGSLARGTFRTHSDIDLMIFGDLSLDRRVLVRRIVSRHVTGTQIKCDLLFVADMSEQSVAEILGG